MSLQPCGAFLLRIWTVRHLHKYFLRLEDIRTGQRITFNRVDEFAEYLIQELDRMRDQPISSSD